MSVAGLVLLGFGRGSRGLLGKACDDLQHGPVVAAAGTGLRQQLFEQPLLLLMMMMLMNWQTLVWWR